MIAPPKSKKLHAGEQPVDWRESVWDKGRWSEVYLVADSYSAIASSVAHKTTQKSAEFRLEGMLDLGEGRIRERANIPEPQSQVNIFSCGRGETLVESPDL